MLQLLLGDCCFCSLALLPHCVIIVCVDGARLWVLLLLSHRNDGANDEVDPSAIRDDSENDLGSAKKTKKKRPYRCHRCPTKLHSYYSCIRHICLIHYRQTLQDWVGQGKKKWLQMNGFLLD